MAIMGKPTFINIYDKLKDRNKQRERVDTYTQDALIFLSSMIDIENFENETGISSKLFQKIKYYDGMVGLAKWDDQFVMCELTQEGLPDKNLKPVNVIAKFWLDQKLFCEKMKVGEDVIILYNNDMIEPEHDAFRVASALSNVDLSLHLNVKYARRLPIFKARSDKEKATFEETIKAMDSGITSLVWDDDVTKDELLGIDREPYINVTDVATADKIQYLLETHDNYLRFFYNKYGLYTSGNSKHAQQSKMEIDNGESASWVYPFMMLDETDKFCKLCNEKWGTTFEAHLSDLHSLLWQKFIKQNAPTVAEQIKADNITDIVEDGEPDLGQVQEDTEEVDENEEI